jgi:hypothetical protein
MFFGRDVPAVVETFRRNVSTVLHPLPEFRELVLLIKIDPKNTF